MATITVRSLGTNYDPLYGNGSNDFLTDLDAVAQIIGTTLRLFQGEWWEDLQAGVPMFQKILGQAGARDTTAISAILTAAIEGVPYVSSTSNVVCTYANRKLAFSCSVLTQFGTLQVSN